MAIFHILLSLATLSLASKSYYEPSQACRYPDKSSIGWTPRANDTRVFNVGRQKDNTREIRITVPPTYNASTTSPPQLIIAFHDRDLGTGEFEFASRLSDPGINQDAVVVYPLAKNDTWESDIQVRRWQRDRSKTAKKFPNDIAWVKQLLADLDTVVCYDTARVHTAGLGTGGGMVHLLACDPEISSKLASYAIVAGGFGTRKVSPKWADCNPGYRPLPILEIHGDEDKVLPYLLNDWEPAKSRMSVPLWLEEWSERNLCGEAVGDTMEGVDGTGTPVTITRLENGGWKSEAEAFDGAAWRLAMSCPGEHHKSGATAAQGPPIILDGNKTQSEDGPEATGGEKKDQVLITSPDTFTLLHYRLKDYGHGWPTLQLKTKNADGKPRFFDATALVLDWFKIHKLPEPDGEVVESTDENVAVEEGPADEGTLSKIMREGEKKGLEEADEGHDEL